MTWNIKTKSTAVLIVAFVMVLGVGAYGNFQLRSVNAEASDIRDDWMPAIKDLGEIKFLITRIRFFAARRLITSSPEQVAELKRREAALSEQLSKVAKHYEETIANANEHGLWDKFNGAWQAYLADQDSIMNDAAKGGLDVAVAAFNTLAARHFDEALAALDADIEFNNRESITSAARAQAAYEKGLAVTFGVVMAALTFLLGVSALVSRDILTPLLRVTRAMKKLANGDLDISVPFAHRRDEIGAMADQLDVFKSNLIARKAAEHAAAAESRKLQESEQKYREVFDNVSDSIFIFNVTDGRDFTVLDMNPAAERLSGSAKGDIIGRRLDDGAAEGTGVEEMAGRMAEPFLRCVESGAPLSFETSVAVPMGNRVLHTMILPVLSESGAIYRVIVFNRDITERKKAEDEVRTLNIELEARVVQRTAALVQSNRELGQANKELELFAYSVSHDLRTPLRAIEGFSAMLLAEHRSQLDEEGQRCLKVIRQGAQRVAKLIDDLLEYSFLLRRTPDRSLVDIGALAQMVFNELKAGTPARDIRLHIGDMPGVMCDSDMIRQVLSQLLSNSLKFTATRAEAVIGISGVSNGLEVIYSIKDNGVGFDMRYVHKLFGVFQRLHGVDEFAGTGIGLAIVKRIIDIHGGKVWAEGKTGEGAVIYFAIPILENVHG